jgi:regulator of sigma E protease
MEHGVNAFSCATMLAMLTLLLFLLVLSVLVLIHELGHYWAARACGVKAEEFGYGIPPRIIGFVKDKGRWKIVRRKDRGTYPNTIWSLNWLPIGGFVRIKGESSQDPDGPDSFHRHPIWQRILILSAGVGMNWFLAAFLFSIGLMAGTPSMLDALPPGATVRDRAITIADVLPESPAAQAGILPNDVILRVDDTPITSLHDVRERIASKGTAETTIVVMREGQERAIITHPVYLSEAGRTGIGIGLMDIGTVSYPPHLAVKNGMIVTAIYTREVVMTFVDLIRDLVHGGGGVSSQVSGPVGIAVATGRVAERGIMPLLQFAAILSINLAVVNFLPIPALDGGRVLFLLIEGFRRRAMNRHVEALIHNVAFLLLIGVIALVTVHDLGTYGGMILGGLKGLFL